MGNVSVEFGVNFGQIWGLTKIQLKMVKTNFFFLFFEKNQNFAFSVLDIKILIVPLIPPELLLKNRTPSILKKSEQKN
jgi:hypothetical protein